MKILFLSISHLNCNSGGHIASLANALVDLGVECLVGVPGKVDTVLDTPSRKFTIIHADALAGCIAEESPDLIHLWTPREGNRHLLNRLLEHFTCPYLVHLEDNEYHLTQVTYGMNFLEYKKLFSGPSTPKVPDHLSDPLKAEVVLKKAIGVTALVEELLEFKPSEVPGAVFLPGYDEHLPWGMPCDKALREKLGIGADEYVVTYTGNLHAANTSEIRSLYLAVALVNRRGIKLRLVRTGQDFVPLAEMGEDILRENSIELGFVPREELPNLLSIADVLVQPGKIDIFNVYRFPSKLPEFLQSKRPVVLPDCNVGSYLENNHNAIVLKKGDALEIAEVLEALLLDREKRDSLGKNGAEFSDKQLRWDIAAQKMVSFYEEVLTCG